MNYNDDYIKRIYELINDSNPELKMLVDRLVIERKNLKEMVYLDSLTNLYNRRILTDDIVYKTVVMCDIDNFKNINDIYGHAYGDKVLKIVSSGLESIVGSKDILCRLGGDEFLIVFSKETSDVVVDKINAVKTAIQNSSFKDDLSISLSFGISEYNDGKSLKMASKEADEALYYSKKNGKDMVTVYNSFIKVLK